MGLGASLITAIPGTKIASADYNDNLNALNTAEAITFATCQVNLSLTPDNTFRGMQMITSTDFGIFNNTNSNYFRLVSGLTTHSKIALTTLDNKVKIGFWDDGTYSYMVLKNYLRFQTQADDGGNSGVNAARLSAGNDFTISSTNYGFITAGNATFNQGSGNADIAEPLLTEGNPRPGMAVCCSKSDTVSPCSHNTCRVAKIVSTSPTILLTPRIQDDPEQDFVPIPGHESAMAIVIGGAAPVLMESPEQVQLRDRITPSGNTGLLRVARDDEYALGDVIKIEDGVIYAWIHY